MKRGFTMIEILVVVAVTTLILSLSTFGYITYQNRSFDSQGKSIAAAMQNALNRYYVKNNEYPGASSLGVTSCTDTPNYDTVSSTLGIAKTTIDTAQLDLRVWPAGTDCFYPNLKKEYVYYVAKNASDSGTDRTPTIDSQSCEFKFYGSESGALSYVLVYYSYEKRLWQIAKSPNGSVGIDITNPDPECVATTL